MTDEHPPQQITHRHLLVILLAMASGSADAISFIALGGVFTSVMTGNMVLLGLSLTQPQLDVAAKAAAAIGCFVLGGVIGARVARRPLERDPVWPAAVTHALVIELAALLVFAVVWEWTDGRPGDAVAVALLTINALALGVQSAAILRFSVPGLSTTYLTGTLTTITVRWSTGERVRAVRTSLDVLLALIAGAAIGGALAIHAPRLAPSMPVLSVAIVVAVAVRRFGWRSRDAVAGPD